MAVNRIKGCSGGFLAVLLCQAESAPLTQHCRILTLLVLLSQPAKVVRLLKFCIPCWNSVKLD